MFLTWALLFALLTAKICTGEESTPEERALLFIPPKYSPLVRPNFGGKATEVSLSMYLSHLELKRHRFNAIFYVRFAWTDPRLKTDSRLDSVTFNAEQIGWKIWTPDVFYPSAIEPTQILNHGFIRATNNGDVLFSQQRKETFACAGATITASNIECTIEIESYGYSTSDIVLKWKNANAVDIDETAQHQELLQVQNYTTGTRNVALSTGNYSRLHVLISFESSLASLPKPVLTTLLERRLRDLEL